MEIKIKLLIPLFCLISINYLGTCSAQNTKLVGNINTTYKECIYKTSNIYVYDYERILSNEEKKILSEIIISYKKNTKREILVITTHSIGNFSNIQEYANNIGSIYSNEIKNEYIVTIAISKNLKKMAIATSPKARNVLTDKACKEIIEKVMIPEVKKGDFYNSIQQGLNELIKKWNKK